MKYKLIEYVLKFVIVKQSFTTLILLLKLSEKFWVPRLNKEISFSYWTISITKKDFHIITKDIEIGLWSL